MNIPANHRKLTETLLKENGQTFASEAGIRLKNQPAPLFQLMILSLMLSARLSSDKAVAATRALFDAGFTTPEKLCEAGWQARVDAITWAGYKRYDERTATLLGEAAQHILDSFGGDLRQARHEADGDPGRLAKALQGFNGIGPLGADIFLREVQAVWPEFRPFADDKVLQAAAQIGLPATRDELSALCDPDDFTRLCAAIVRTRLHKEVDRVREAALG